MADIITTCDCGAVEGKLTGVSGTTGTRVTCYCADCQAFQEFLGKSDEVLDAHGGTDIFQTQPSKLEFTKGKDKLACVRVTDGKTLRWYASCCRSPIGNTASSRKMAFIGFIRSFLKETTDGGGVEAAIGPSRGGVFTDHARGDISHVQRGNMPALYFIFLRRMLMARLTGAYKKTPFFTDDDEPVAPLQTLSAEERAAIDNRLESRP